ncbi:2'-5' RNA ligase family protein [Baaleninema sp.]|uniref:2'-5' RNA ligase family protein n=1 Tax=Baaleninema sp. TaxID=3101197 RepID=UPI003D00CCAF
MLSHKTYSVELYFDENSSNRIRQLWEKVRSIASGSPARFHSRPHISLAVLADGNASELATLVSTISRQESSLELQFSSVGVFPTDEGIIFLAPVVTQSLLQLHQQFHQQLKAIDAVSIEYYQPHRWVPHCTIAQHLKPDEIAKALEIVRSSDLFDNVTLCEIGLVEAFPVQTVCSIPLDRDDGMMG